MLGTIFPVIRCLVVVFLFELFRIGFGIIVCLIIIIHFVVTITTTIIIILKSIGGIAGNCSGFIAVILIHFDYYFLNHFLILILIFIFNLYLFIIISLYREFSFDLYFRDYCLLCLNLAADFQVRYLIMMVYFSGPDFKV